ncbi:MAG: MIP/aquaporin family protein [Pseudomonadota bacterium]
MNASLTKKATAEFLGTAFLLATVVGSGIMAERLSGGNVALALLGNTLPTGAILVVLIVIFGPLSGAHFNPAVTLAFLSKKEIAAKVALIYIVVQVAGALTGTWSAHIMFEETVLQTSVKQRSGFAQWFSELIATFGLLMAILGSLKSRPEFVPYAVGLYITAAYWFTASTSFANPAVTIARSLTNTFSGIDPSHMPAFVIAQIAGALLAVAVFGWLFSICKSKR